MRPDEDGAASAMSLAGTVVTVGLPLDVFEN
jgi:hypothetical protein